MNPEHDVAKSYMLILAQRDRLKACVRQVLECWGRNLDTDHPDWREAIDAIKKELGYE